MNTLWMLHISYECNIYNMNVKFLKSLEYKQFKYGIPNYL